MTQLEGKEKYKLKMLWHAGFYDYPQDGLALYNCEKVYFKVKNSPDIVNKFELDQEDIDVLNKIELDCVEKMYNYFPDDYDPELIGEYKEYTISRYDKFVVKKKLSYKIYRMPPQVLAEFEAVNKEFNENVGYHNHHDPSAFKRYVGCVNEDYWKKKREPIVGFDVNNFEYLGSFYWDEFEYFQRF